MIRRAVAVTVGALAWLALAALPAGAQAAAAPPPSTDATATVVVDLTGAVDPRTDRGVLARTDDRSTAPMLAVYLGLSVLGLTLGLIIGRRHLLATKASELVTGVVVGRRARGEFWTLGAGPDRVAAASATGPPRLGPAARSGRALLLGSGDTVTIAEHGLSVRAGYAGGATNG